MTQELGLIGYPLSQSISPLFQQAALDHYGLDIRYERWETPPAQLPAVVGLLRGEARLGANVTVPHKQSVVPLLEGLDQSAVGVGAVNTIVKRGGGLEGHNTDYLGFLKALRDDGGFDPVGRRALVLGAGGAARAVAYGLVTAGAAFVGIAARNPEQAGRLRSVLQDASSAGPTRIFVEEWGSESMALALSTYDLVVNATPVGMLHGRDEGRSPLEGLEIGSGSFIYDLVYNPPQTPLLLQARAAGCGTLGGLTMLVYQGAAAFELWTGREAPVSVMRSAAEAAMAHG